MIIPVSNFDCAPEFSLTNRLHSYEVSFKPSALVLEERRMKDKDSNGRTLPLDYKLVDRDADELYRSVRAEKGGESAMIGIVVQRSDTHLRAVLKEYERAYRGNFAKDALKKSGNLVVSLSLLFFFLLYSFTWALPPAAPAGEALLASLDITLDIYNLLPPTSSAASPSPPGRGRRRHKPKLSKQH